MLYNQLLEIIGHYFKVDLWAIAEFFTCPIQLDPNYNQGAEHHRPNLKKHLLFQNYIGTIDETHVRAMLLHDQRINFIGRKGIPTQNVLVACDFNLCFTLMLAGRTGNT